MSQETRHEISSFRGEHFFLSNFYSSPVTVDNIYYPTVEHAYQASKTLDYLERERIRRAQTPGIAKKLGKRITLREDWEDIKLSVMEYLLRQKFSREPLREKLKQTGDADLIEGNLWGDRFWGVYNGKGENHLGRLLMKIRDEL